MASNAVPAKASKQKTLSESAPGKMQLIHTQQEWLRRLEQDMDDKEAQLKKAKRLVEQALLDLRKLCDPAQPTQCELFAGELLVDPITGLVRGYRTIADIEAEIQAQKDAEQREKERKLRKSEADASAGGN